MTNSVRCHFKEKKNLLINPTMSETKLLPYRMPVYRGMFNFVSAVLRAVLHRVLQMGMRDVMNRDLRPGDRVFDLNAYTRDDFHTSDPYNYGTIVEDHRSITGLAIRWDNEELTQLINPVTLLKKNV